MIIFPCSKDNQKNSNQISPKECNSIKRMTTHFYKCKGILSCTFKKGSYTLEAAVIFPLVTAFFVSILFFFRVLQIGTSVQCALTYAGRMTAVEASSVNESAMLLLSAEGFFRSKISSDENIKDYVSGGNYGVSLLSSDVSGDDIKLTAKYWVKLPVDFFNVKGISIIQTSCSRKWTGKSSTPSNPDIYVYYTESGSVYHMTTSCSYIDLSIRGIQTAQIKGSRNKNGGKYSACTHCAAKKTTNNIYFITDYGTKYHTTCACSSLKRTVHMVKLSEVGGRKACSKCGKQ